MSPPPCRFTVLGPPGLACGGTRLDLGTPQQQAVLMLLLSNSGSFVRIGEVIDGLWGEHAPATGEAVVRTYISRLRRLLSAHGLDAAISSRSGGYMLDPALFAVDAVEFADLLEAARQEREGGHLPGAVKLLEQALGLWTGTALAGVPGEAAERERYRLERLRLVAVQELLRLRLERGEHAEVAAEVPLLIERNRLEEPLYEIYLLALYRGGRRAEALEVYRMVYDLLGKELGVSPGPRLRAVHDRILRAEPDSDDEPAPASPVTAVSGVAAVSREAGASRVAALGRREPSVRPAGARFVGRAAERAAFVDLLEQGRPGVLFVRGPAGIGKSALLCQLAEDAAAEGRPVRHLRAGAEARGRLERVAGARECLERGAGLRERLERCAEELAGAVGPVLLIDSFEELAELEPWLRDDYLRRLPADTVVVLAGRTGPSAAWLTDPAWSGAITIRHLEALTAAESTALLEARGVEPGLRGSIADFAAGHPFALSLAAEVGRSMSATGQPARREAVRQVVDEVLARLAGDVPSELHRRALHVCAHARHTTEDLLAAVLPEGRAAELFDWLAAQPYVETAARGLDVGGVLREALDHHLRWRDPAGYERMHRTIRHYAMGDLLRGARDPLASVAVMRTISRLRRRGGVLNRYVSQVGEEDVRACEVTPADHDELVAMARESQGELTAASVRFWLNRRPEAFTLLRSRADNRLRAYLTWLTLRRLEPEELDADPVVGEIWHDVSRRMALPQGAHVGIARHLICPAFEAKPSPITDVFQAWLLRRWLHEPGLAASYLLVANGPLWRPLMAYLGQYELTHAGAGHPYAIFGHDWLADPPEAWRDHHLDEELWADRGPGLFVRQDVSREEHG
ncbi:BTAD domain-containing putative transcriptional regulator [Nonomuraea gerenzanensis]|uniref:Putative regulatory protein n=1 Tax=Nonomuraea gerenzanensis TaxID=93944 RepID=A0A1M4ELX1_9ACTN|nr:BTAD domain-containing putative transcriptional regulator [Nonomuraea gerenzanensis]UBU11354.1 winged helix-turn-helix domain-containing protein [Nonomuraea gerenzanensis]SBO99832.1 putative regulatory protein [Nonomuraea gerenzanensis]